MRVFIDSIIYYLQQSGGISVYWTELLKRMTKDYSLDVYINYSVFGFNNYFGSDLKAGKNTPSFYRVSRYFDYPILKNFDLTHTSYYRLPMRKRKTLIVNTLHDFTYEYYIKGIPGLVHSAQKKRAINGSDGLIAISENTKKDVLKFYPDLDPSKVKVIYNGVSEKYMPIMLGNEYDLKDKYILFVGGRDGYKNFISVVEALSYLNDFMLYIVGSKLKQYEVELLDIYLKNRYKFFGYVTDEELNVLYNSAFAFVYPSLYEGFGIPVVEAMASGCPIIASNESSIPEVAGDAGILIDEICAETISSAISDLKNSDFRNKVIHEGLQQAKKFNWDKCYKETTDFYKELLENRG